MCIIICCSSQMNEWWSKITTQLMSYEPDGTPLGRNYILYAYCLMSNHIHLLIREREISYNKLNDLVNTSLSDDVACLDI